MKKLIEIIIRPEVQALLDHVGALLDVRIIFLSPRGEELRVGLQKPVCAYCRQVQRGLGLAAACLEEDRRRREEALHRGLVAYECHAGLREAILPVRVGARLAGFAMVGQYRTREAPPARLGAAARRDGRARVAADAFGQVPFFAPDREPHLLGLFAQIVRSIEAQHFVQTRNQHALAPVLGYMQEHPERPLSLADAAALAHRSPSTLSHQFHRHLGKGFKQVQIELRLDRFEELLRAEPGRTIAETAAAAGFEDAHYFSRLYRRHRGRTPRAFKEAT